MVIRLVDVGTVDHVRSQSVYHGLGYAQEKSTPNTLVLAQPDSAYMCIGYFQDVTHEINEEYCKKNKLPIIRRETGGGAVYIDNNQVFTQWIFQNDTLPKRLDHRFQLFLDPIVETLKFFGIEAYYHPINDVHVGGKKIVGTGAATIGNADVVTGNFLFEFDYQTMTNALTVPDKNFQDRVRGGMRQFMTTINEQLENPPGMEEVKEVYLKKCGETLDIRIENGEFSLSEIKAIEDYDRKLTDRNWIYQNRTIDSSGRIVKIHAGVWIGQVRHSTEGGDIEVLISMNNNVITGIDLKPNLRKDFNFEMDDFEKSLINTELSTGPLSKAVDKYFDTNNVSDTGVDPIDWIQAIMKVKTLQQKLAGNGSMER